MKIEQAQVQFAASHHKAEHTETSEQLRVWQDGGPSLEYRSDSASTSLLAEAERLRDTPAGERPSIEELRKRLPAGDVVEFSPAALAAHAKEAKGPDDDLTVESLGDLKLSMTKLMIEAYTGRKIEIYHPHRDGDGGGAAIRGGDRAKGGEAAQGAEEREGWGLVYDYRETHLEEERTRFQAEGVVRTADGREISFTAELDMHRQFASTESLSVRAGDGLKDPLVINYNGTAARLTEERMAFDIDDDGKKDEIALLAPNSAYLALDRNGDGRINDGGELFGPKSGNGFTELSALDEDGNRWIDENDSGYSKLLLWSPDEEGIGSLKSLAEGNVGAIYLGRVSTQFDLKDSANELQGQVRTSGVYLNEDGTPGTIQQIDLVV